MILHGCVTAEIIFITAAARFVVSTWSWDHVLDASMGFTMKALAAVALGLDWSNIMVMLHEIMLWFFYKLCYGYVVAAAVAVASVRGK